MITQLKNSYKVYLIFLCIPLFAKPVVKLGIDRFFNEGLHRYIENKNVALLINQCSVDQNLNATLDLFIHHANQKRPDTPAGQNLKIHPFTLSCIFSPEHGLDGSARAWEKVKHSSTKKLKIHSLHSETRRPTKEMLKGLDCIVIDIQDIGSRTYTYISTLFYVMQEAAKYNIEVIVLDRPNPMGGLIVDGPMLEEKWRSYIGYINVAYCHGMTIAELARYFNKEYKVGCSLKIVKMRGWNREMTFSETGLSWIQTSAHIPEGDTPFFYATTGIIGELGLVNIGVGYTLPFKVIGQTYIDSKKLCQTLNAHKLEGVKFQPISYRPFYGKLKETLLHGAKIHILNPIVYKPVKTCYTILSTLKSLYPKQIKESMSKITKTQRNLFNKANGTDTVFNLLQQKGSIAYKLINLQEAQREEFISKRKHYLLYPNH